ncbi:MAG: serine hydrolase domain-containing protein [Pseudomonadota bacterium]
MIRALLTCWLIAVASIAHADLRADLEKIVADSTLPSLAYALIEDGKVIQIDVIGDAPRDALYRAGSISKSVTTATILSLVEDGVLDLEASFVEAIPNANLANEYPDPIRLVDLLEQTSGLPGTSYADYANQPTDLPALAVARSRTLKTRWAPGKFFSYANVNHTLAAAMAEAATDKTVDALVAEHVFRPLGMEDATFDRAEAADRLLQSVDAAGVPQDYWDLEVRPSGALIGTIDDLAAFARFIATDDTVPNRMRTPEAALVAQQGFPFIYGAGLFAFIENESVYYGHWGRIDGFQAVLGTNPAAQSGFVLLTNGADRTAFGQARARIAAAVDGAPLPTILPSAPFEGDVEGWWLPFTDDNVKRSWISEILGLVRINQSNGGLVLSRGVSPWALQRLTQINPSSYALPGFPVATHVFATDINGTPYLLGDGQASYRKISSAEAAARIAALCAFLATSIVSIVVGLLTLLRRLARPTRPSDAVWLTLSAAATSALALVALHVVWGMLSSQYAALATPGPRSLILLGLSLAWPICVAVTFVLILNRAKRLGWITGGFGTLAVASSTVAIAYLATFQFVPLITWL